MFVVIYNLLTGSIQTLIKVVKVVEENTGSPLTKPSLQFSEQMTQ